MNKNIKLIKKVRRQDHYFSTRLPYANRKITEIWMNMINTTYNALEDIIIEVQNLKGKRKLKFYQIISNYFDEMNKGNFQFEQDDFPKNAEGNSKNYLEIILLLKFLQIKPQVRHTNVNYYLLDYTVIKNRDDKEIVNDQVEDFENDYNFEDFITPNHYFGRKNNN